MQFMERVCVAFFSGVSLSAAIAACSGGNANTGGSAQGQQGDVELTLVSYAVTRAAYERSFLSSPLSGNRITTKHYRQ